MARASASAALPAAVEFAGSAVRSDRKVVRRPVRRDTASASASAGRRSTPRAAVGDAVVSSPEDEFVRAIEAYKISSGRMFPTWSEVLEVLRDLGYVKTDSIGPKGAAAPGAH